mmetsp:Transcript_31780/g.66122  ORF Transcript_31780/g.66122 Transcript_31780/m.66122 type:complete len:90 (+) Transcript_31780:23-292(+)
MTHIQMDPLHILEHRNSINHCIQQHTFRPSWLNDPLNSLAKVWRTRSHLPISSCHCELVEQAGQSLLQLVDGGLLFNLKFDLGIISDFF